MSEELEYIWARVQGELAQAVDEPTYRIWLEPLRARELSDGRLTVEAPAHAHRWIRERFGRLLCASAELAAGPDILLELVADELDGPADTLAATLASVPSTRLAQTSLRAGPRSRATASADAPREHDGASSHPGTVPVGNPKLTFGQFVIGDSNRLAHAAALTVAEMPAQAYNPLFLCGPPGVGKTHLLSAIASLLLSHNPGLTVRITTGETFTNEFLDALGAGHTDTFKARFRDVDVLLMDDVQFLERKVKTEEEFFHTFNALHDGGRQIVLTSDRAPQDLEALEDRLRERFQAGLVAEIKLPGFNTRLAILRKRAQHDHITVADDDALTVIAERIDSNIRALEGALIRVVAFSSLTGRPLTGELAHEVLATLYPRSSRSSTRRARSLDEIQTATCEHFGVSAEELLSPARTRRIAWPRQLAMYLARELTDESLPAIGRHFGGRDHTTVLHAWRRTSARLMVDDDARRAVKNLCARLDIVRP